jgi:hypothetical protein
MSIKINIIYIEIDKEFSEVLYNDAPLTLELLRRLIKNKPSIILNIKIKEMPHIAEIVAPTQKDPSIHTGIMHGLSPHFMKTYNYKIRTQIDYSNDSI